MPPAILIDVGLKTFWHPRRLAICGLIADRARHPGSATAAAVRAFPGMPGMLLTHPAAIVTVRAGGHAATGRWASRTCLSKPRISISSPQKQRDRPPGTCVGSFMSESDMAYFHAVQSRWSRKLESQLPSASAGRSARPLQTRRARRRTSRRCRCYLPPPRRPDRNAAPCPLIDIVRHAVTPCDRPYTDVHHEDAPAV